MKKKHQPHEQFDNGKNANLFFFFTNFYCCRQEWRNIEQKYIFFIHFLWVSISWPSFVELIVENHKRNYLTSCEWVIFVSINWIEGNHKVAKWNEFDCILVELIKGKSGKDNEFNERKHRKKYSLKLYNLGVFLLKNYWMNGGKVSFSLRIWNWRKNPNDWLNGISLLCKLMRFSFNTIYVYNHFSKKRKKNVRKSWNMPTTFTWLNRLVIRIIII